VANRLATAHGLSIARACQAVSLSRAAYYRQGVCWKERDGPVIDALNGIVEKHARWGFWKCHDRLRLDGHGWNHKRVHRVYCQLNLNLPRRTKKRLPHREPRSLVVPAAPNQIWSMDFMSDTLYDGRRFRTFNVLDEGVREGLAIEVDTSLPAKRVVRTLSQLKGWRGLPRAIRLDNGPEFIAEELATWCRENQVELWFIEPGKPDQNAFIERFNRSYREEVLNAHLFDDLDQVREITHHWLKSYNEERPHDALGSLPPAIYRQRITAEKNSTSKLST
jgi:putative transposase